MTMSMAVMSEQSRGVDQVSESERGQSWLISYQLFSYFRTLSMRAPGYLLSSFSTSQRTIELLAKSL